MRTRNFLVPTDLIEEFATAIEEYEFDNRIVGTSSEGEIEISIDYDADQKKVINQLQDKVDEYNYDDEEEDDDDDEDDD